MPGQDAYSLGSVPRARETLTAGSLQPALMAIVATCSPAACGAIFWLHARRALGGTQFAQFDMPTPADHCAGRGDPFSSPWPLPPKPFVGKVALAMVEREREANPGTPGCRPFEWWVF